MSIEIEEEKVLKLKLFEHLDSAEGNISLGAAQLLVRLREIPARALAEEQISVMRELLSSFREWLEREKGEKGK